MKSIKRRISVSMIVMTAVFVLLVGGVSIVLSYRSSEHQLEISMTGTVEVATDRIEKELEAYRNVAYAAGAVKEFANPIGVAENKKRLLDSWAEQYGFQRGNILDLEGNSLFDGNNYKERVYFQEALKGNTYISTPVVSKVTGELTIMVAAPLWKDGVPGSEVVGALYFVPKETFLNDIMTSIHVSENSTAYMIDADGYTIADITLDTITVQNIEQEAQSDSKLQGQAALHSRMRSGESGLGTYKKDGVKSVLAYAPVEGTDGWSLALTAPVSDFQSATKQALLITAALIVASIVAALIFAARLSVQIANPIRLCAQRLKQLSGGDLHTEVPQIQTRDETGVLADATQVIVKTMNQLIQDEQRLLGSMANRNFDVCPDESIYVGDLALISQHIQKLTEEMSRTMNEISVSASQVSTGAEQVSAAAQSLSEGAILQASSTEQLSAALSDMNSEMQKTAESAEIAKDAAVFSGEATTLSNQKMQELSDAMEEMTKASREIGKIIKTIEDIAFQTNMLALNAAVEASRAGTAGKGFAVVAGEVRNLASKSSEASKITTQLIEQSLKAIKNGSTLAHETKEAMEASAISAEQTVQLIQDISRMVSRQAEAADRIHEEIDKISSVVQTNSATAEESAATSEELSGQAETMEQMLDNFQLKA